MIANHLLKLATVVCVAAVVALPTALAAPDNVTPSTNTALGTAEAALYTQLSTSAEPVERALAAWMVAATTDAARTDRRQVLDYAAVTSPKDALVQWLAANVLDRCAASDANSGSLQLLQQLEPGNAAVGLLELNRANVCRNQQGIVTAFASMARGTRFDRHTDQIVRSWLTILLNYPAGKAVMRALPSGQASPLETALRYAYNSEEARFQALLGGCRNPKHATQCAKIGRLMAYQGKTLTDRQAGFGILQMTNNLRTDDRARLRELHWLLQPKSALPVVGQAAYSKAILAGWIAGDDEAAIAGKALVAAGLPAAPPSNWVDPTTPNPAMVAPAS